MRRVARRHGVADRLLFLGHIGDRGELAALMATADCFLHPNPTEPYGLCPLEALAAGCRAVAPDTAGCAEVLSGRGAVLVDTRDPVALAGAIGRALAGPRPRRAMDDLDCEATFAREWAVYEELATAA
jgi:alpha-1,6-mannosyltransferase